MRAEFGEAIGEVEGLSPVNAAGEDERVRGRSVIRLRCAWKGISMWLVKQDDT